LSLKKSNNVTLQLYYQLIIDGQDKDYVRPKEYYVLVNALNVPDVREAKFLKLSVKENSKFLKNDKVDDIVRWKEFVKGKYTKKFGYTIRDVKGYIREEHRLKINDDGSITSIAGEGSYMVRQYNKLISRGIGASKYYLRYYENHDNKSWISPNVVKLVLKIKDTLKYMKKNNKDLLDFFEDYYTSDTDSDSSSSS